MAKLQPGQAKSYETSELRNDGQSGNYYALPILPEHKNCTQIHILLLLELNLFQTSPFIPEV